MILVRAVVILLVGVANTLIASTGASGGRVVCFGFDGHIGIESAQTKEACCDKEATPHVDGEASVSTRGGCPCIDIPIPHGGRTIEARATTAPKHDLQVAAIHSMKDILLAASQSDSIGGNDTPPPVPSSRVALRAIVLLV
jgi:hypothetical protein